MRLIIDIARRYPWQTVLMLLALVCAGFAEGLSLSSLLPMLSMAVVRDGSVGAEPRQQAGLEQLVGAWLDRFGLEPDIGILLAVMLLGITLKSLLLLYANRLVGYTSARFATDLRMNLLRCVLGSRWEYFLHQPLGNLCNALSNETQRSAAAFVNGINAATFLVQALIYAAVALAISWKATLACLALGVIIIGLSGTLVHMARRAGRTQTRYLRSLSARLADALQSLKSLKSMSKEHLVSAVLASDTARLDTALRQQIFSAAALVAAQEQMFAIAITGGMFIALVWFDMPVATVMVLVLILGRMLAQFGKVQKEYQKVAVGESAWLALEKTIAQARMARDTQGGQLLPSLDEGIRLESVCLRRGAMPVLENLDLEIPACALVTLMGASGCGKTTILDLITGLVEPSAGRVLVDGVPLEQLDIGAWRRSIGYVAQETVLLHDTILNNITLGDPQFDAGDVEYALQIAGAGEFVAAFPEGVHHVVGERGGMLSGGQRQRLMIARAMLHRPRLLILDEATSALDQEGEAAICDTLRGLRGQLTIIAVSHRDALAGIADHVYHVDQGRAGAPAVPWPQSNHVENARFSLARAG
ncbi:MAG: ABC transporter ATP-binding protein [Gammaproteobacteria bacterium]|nr:ABC transporter ATP-binding protein [Gammaproteobacteria bacterium]MBK8309040.1 ABC transporter ATP-binding protein [Gammaproteobacteria bacterium]